VSDENPYRSPTTAGGRCGERLHIFLARIGMGILYAGMAYGIAYRLLFEDNFTPVEQVTAPLALASCVVTSLFYLVFCKFIPNPTKARCSDDE